MALNTHNYEIKDAKVGLGYPNAEWLFTKEFNSQYQKDLFFYPHEKILNKFTKSHEHFYLAKFDKSNSKHIKLISEHELNFTKDLADSKTQVLRLDKGSYYWHKICNSSTASLFNSVQNPVVLLPRNSLRADYDPKYKNFIFIARINKPIDNEDNYLYGFVINICDYLPANVFKLCEDEDSKDELISNSCNLVNQDYEILCLKSSPASLKQLCALKILTYEYNYINKWNRNDNEKQMLSSVFYNHYGLPPAIYSLIWPSRLHMNECLQKFSVLKSPNGLYEMSINENGLLILRKYVKNELREGYFKLCNYLYEKDVESLLLCKYGLMIIYNRKQENRRPTLVYQMKGKLLQNCQYLQLTDVGNLVLRSYLNHTNCVMLNLNEFIPTTKHFIDNNAEIKKTESSRRVFNVHNVNLSLLHLDKNDEEKYLFKIVIHLSQYNFKLLINTIVKVLQKIYNWFTFF